MLENHYVHARIVNRRKFLRKCGTCLNIYMGTNYLNKHFQQLYETFGLKSRNICKHLRILWKIIKDWVEVFGCLSNERGGRPDYGFMTGNWFPYIFWFKNVESWRVLWLRDSALKKTNEVVLARNYLKVDSKTNKNNSSNVPPLVFTRNCLQKSTWSQANFN